MTEVDIRHGDCLEVLRDLPDNSVDSIVTDPPYGLSNTKPAQVADVLKAWVTGDTVSVPAKRGGFMGKDWDSFVPPPAVWEECMRVLKPGGHMAVFAGARTQDLMGLSIRLAGFEIRDTLGWIYGCLSEDTEVLINGEWVQYHKAKVGDLALCYNKEHDTYEWQPIEDTHKYKYGDTAYRIRSDNTDQIVSRNHRVLVERGGAYEFEFAENLAREHQIRVPVLESLPALLDDLPVPQQVPGGEEPILQRELRNVRPPTGCGEADGTTRNDGDCMCRLRDEGVQAERLVETDENADVLTRVQREVARGEVEGARTQGASGVVGGNESAVRGKSAWREEPCLEGRGDVETRPRELQGCPVCEVPAGVPEHVSQGWVRDGALTSRGEGNREAAAADGDCASCESQAGGQSAGEPLSVCVEPGSQAVRGARYTAADLAEIEPVRYEGVVWCLTVPTGAFVARRNGKVFVTGNSGFPKSMDVSKAIDKRGGNAHLAKEIGKAIQEARESRGLTKGWCDERFCGGTTNWSWFEGRPTGIRPPTVEVFNQIVAEWPELREYAEKVAEADREVVGSSTNGIAGGTGEHAGEPGSYGFRKEFNLTTPATSDAQRWDGWGTALKPAIEPIILARKPLDGTVAQNVLEHGVGGLNIDASRVASTDKAKFPSGVVSSTEAVYGGGGGMYADRPRTEDKNPAGRFPANVLLDEHAAKELDKQSGVSVSRANTSSDGRVQSGSVALGDGVGRRDPSNSHTDSGGASRFFPVFKYQAKAPKKERPVIVREDGTKIQHPTVKPEKLMEWLVTLTTPPGGTVLDPFAGTGTTLQAARNKGFNAIGIEQDPDYIQLINDRLETLDGENRKDSGRTNQ